MYIFFPIFAFIKEWQSHLRKETDSVWNDLTSNLSFYFALNFQIVFFSIFHRDTLLLRNLGHVQVPVYSIYG